jgi:hypothetical protein
LIERLLRPPHGTQHGPGVFNFCKSVEENY